MTILWQILLYGIWGHITAMLKYHNVGIRSMDKKYYVLCSKTYNASGSLSWLPAVYPHAARGARISETHRRRFGNRIPYRLSYWPDIALPVSKRYQMAFYLGFADLDVWYIFDI